MKALIDADVLCFQAASIGDGHLDISWSDELTVSKGWTELTLREIDRQVEDILKATGCEGVLMAFSDQKGRNFRKDFCPHYKANRSQDKPSDYGLAVQYIKDKWEYSEYPGLEGDDVVGLLLTGKPDTYVAVSTDKDILTLPGWVMRLGQHDEPWLNHEEDADRYWMSQTIMGDPVDNYKGAPGAGPKRAEAVLKDVRTLPRMWDRVLEVYADQFDHKRWGEKFTQRTAYDEALMNARCARILRGGDLDDNGKVKLWTP